MKTLREDYSGQEVSKMLLEEFDPAETAVINPWNIIEPVEGMPKIAIACYAQATFLRMVEELDAVVIAQTSSANGIKPVYRAVHKGLELARRIKG